MKKQKYKFCKCGASIKRSETPLCGFCACAILYSNRTTNYFKKNGVNAMFTEATPYTFEKENDSLSGTFVGIGLEPWPQVLIEEDGGCIYGIGLSYYLKQFFELTKLPTETKITIHYLGKKKTNSGRTVNLLRVEVDEQTLPKSYVKNNLKPKILNPAKDKIDWDALYATQNSSSEQQEELPF